MHVMMIDQMIIASPSRFHDDSGGLAGNSLLQSQVCLRSPLQHRHSPPHQHTQDHAGESHQGDDDDKYDSKYNSVVSP